MKDVYTLGYNDFNNLVMQTLWWMPNKIVRHIHKKNVSRFFEQNFTLISNPLKKLWKNAPKKLLAKTWRKYALFSLLLVFVQLVFLIAFLVHFYNFFNGFEISVKFSVFWYIFWFFSKTIFLGHISTFWKLRSQTRNKLLKKSKNEFSKCVLNFNFAPINGSVFFIF